VTKDKEAGDAPESAVSATRFGVGGISAGLNDTGTVARELCGGRFGCETPTDDLPVKAGARFLTQSQAPTHRRRTFGQGIDDSFAIAHAALDGGIERYAIDDRADSELNQQHTQQRPVGIESPAS
jgi:hypothetical protein